MTTLQKASLEEIREAAARICRDYLTGRWKEVSAEQLIVKRISGGLSNFLYYISLPEAETSCTNSGSEHEDRNSNVDLVESLGDGDSEGCAGAHKRQRTHSGGDNGNMISINRQHCAQQSQQTEPQEVLLRIYGQIHGDDALEGMITESVVFALLSERNFGPKLHGVFPGGRIEQYIQARPLATLELSDPRISMKIAEKMGEIHSLNIPMSKEPDWLWNCMDRWLNTIGSLLSRTDWKDVDERLVNTVRSFDYNNETKWLKSVIELGNYPVFFCHNDLQEGNILFRESPAEAATFQSPSGSLSSLRSNFEDSAISGLEDVAATILEVDVDAAVVESNKRKRPKTNHNNNNTVIHVNDLDSTRDSALSTNSDDHSPDLIIIDFEYCAYNYRGFDLANHFLEWTFDYNNPTFPFYGHYKQQYPTQQQRQDFMTAYLKKLHENVEGYIPITSEVAALDQEVRIFSMFSHIFWSLWSVVNVSSNIEFGYWEYATTRISEFHLLKQQYLASQANV